MDFAQSLTYWYLIHLSSLNQSRNGPHHRLQRIIDTVTDGSLIGSIHLFHEADSQSSFGAPQRVSSRGFKLQIKYTYMSYFNSKDSYQMIYSYYIILYHSVYVFMMFRTCISNLTTILIVTVTSSLASYSNQVLNRCQLCIYKKAKECILIYHRAIF